MLLFKAMLLLYFSLLRLCICYDFVEQFDAVFDWLVYVYTCKCMCNVLFTGRCIANTGDGYMKVMQYILLLGVCTFLYTVDIFHHFLYIAR